MQFHPAQGAVFFDFLNQLFVLFHGQLEIFIAIIIGCMVNIDMKVICTSSRDIRAGRLQRYAQIDRHYKGKESCPAQH